MGKSFTTTENGRTITNVVPDTTATIFGDGFGPALIGYPSTKFTVFQQLLGTPGSEEIEREIVATITVPTIALLELSAHVQRVLNENKTQFSSDLQEQLNRLLGAAS